MFPGTTSTSAEVREASNSATNLINAAEAQTLIREDLFHLIDVVYERNEVLDRESKFYLETKHGEFVRNGIGISDEQKRERYTTIQARLNELVMASRKSINAPAGIWLSQAELDGIPPDYLARLDKGEGENAGKQFLQFRKPHFEIAMAWVKKEEVRKRIYTGNDNRCPENVGRLKEIILLRDEASKLLGLRNHVEFKMQIRMAKHREFVDEFLDDLRKKLTPIAIRQIDGLLKLKRTKLEDESGGKGLDASDPEKKFYVWDYSYYKKFSEYFELNHSLEGMMAIFSQIFGLQFIKISPDQYSEFGDNHVMTWHESVSIFTVWDDEATGGEFRGYLYLDLFPRPHKFNHAGHLALQRVYFPPLPKPRVLTKPGPHASRRDKILPLLRPSHEPPSSTANKTLTSRTRGSSLPLSRTRACDSLFVHKD
jgi:metallopeptidase MepB